MIVKPRSSANNRAVIFRAIKDLLKELERQAAALRAAYALLGQFSSARRQPIAGRKRRSKAGATTEKKKWIGKRG